MDWLVAVDVVLAGVDVGESGTGEGDQADGGAVASWVVAVVAAVAAVISPLAALGGVWLGERLRSQGEERAWERDRRMARAAELRLAFRDVAEHATSLMFQLGLQADAWMGRKDGRELTPVLVERLREWDVSETRMGLVAPPDDVVPPLCAAFRTAVLRTVEVGETEGSTSEQVSGQLRQVRARLDEMVDGMAAQVRAIELREEQRTVAQPKDDQGTNAPPADKHD